MVIVVVVVVVVVVVFILFIINSMITCITVTFPFLAVETRVLLYGSRQVQEERLG